MALQLIKAGPVVRYQNYKPFDHFLTEPHPLLLIYLAVQTILVVAGFRTIWPKIRVWISRHFKFWQLFGVGLVFFLSSATVSWDIPVYVGELFFATFVQAVNLGNIVLMVWALPDEVVTPLRLILRTWLGQSGREAAGSR